MDIEALTKLNELKEKGVLSQEEFESHKAALLNNTAYNQQTTQQNKGVNWKNVGTSFLISLIYYIFLVFLIYGIGEERAARNCRNVINFLCAIVMAMIAFSQNSGRYKNCSSSLGIFFIVFLLGPIGLWGALYQFLQIKQGNAVLKEIKKK